MPLATLKGEVSTEQEDAPRNSRTGFFFINGNITRSDVGNTEMVAGTIETSAVGLKYYKGGVEVGDILALEREPGNAHDSYAIKVLNATKNHQVGHIPRGVACILAPLLDQGFISVSVAPLTSPSPTALSLLLFIRTIYHHISNGLIPTLTGCSGFRQAAPFMF
eukprot:TRINITY_DN2576_c4_g1_i1.p1 TRINITY_DN2576_c4_g1~~TRINITY_DN2576_c4_g1_i1.p1  ORF type:complete len:164 (+),score=15.13 TRINITY_DN2576_c4_g1_i1:145-636(+)